VGLIQSVVEAIHGEDDRIAGQSVTRLVAPLTATSSVAIVQSTIGFGLLVDGTLQALLLIEGEVVEAVSRTQVPGNFQFLSLTRGARGTEAKAHPAGALVYDVAGNSSARDLVSRGLFVDTAQDTDLDVIGRNLGLHKCAGLPQETWRRVIKAVAYLPKQPLAAFERVLTAYFNNTTSWEIYELPRKTYEIFVDVDVDLATSVQGRFFLNGGLSRLTTGLTTVTTPYPIGHVLRVVLATTNTRRGHRFGVTNYFSSFVGSTITLNASPGAIGTEVLIDWRPASNSFHYLAPDTGTVNAGDRYAYFSDSTSILQCLLDQVRAAGTRVTILTRVAGLP